MTRHDDFSQEFSDPFDDDFDEIDNKREKQDLKGRVFRFLLGNVHYLFIALLFSLMILFYFWRGIVIIIHSGEAGVLYRPFGHGTVTDYVYPEGLHIIAPWNTMFIYNIRAQTTYHEFNVLTNKGLPIKLTLAIRYHPEYDMVALLHQKVGPDYVNIIVIPQIESVLRRSIGQYDPEVIYANKGGILSNILVKAMEEAGQKYVHIDDIIIRTVELPPSIKKAIEEKLVYEQQEQAYVFRLEREKQEAERKRIEATGIKNYQEIVSQTLTDPLIRWQGVQATLQLSESSNAKVVVIGSGENGLPIILGGQ